MSHLVRDQRKSPATGSYACRDCGTEVTADTFHPVEACAWAKVVQLLVTLEHSSNRDEGSVDG